MTSEIIQINSNQPESDRILRVVECLKMGHIVAYPTETVYGLGADLFDKGAVKRIYDLKKRDYGLPIPILVSDMDMLRDIVAEIPERAEALIRRFWPGPLTILFPASKKIPKSMATNTGKIGIRISSNLIATAMVRQLGHPITTTSANHHDFPPSLNIKHVQRYFGDKISCIIDGGECAPSRGSTVVDVTDETCFFDRVGSIPAEDVIKCFQSS
ncbi:threonylcarbamoyl-AMP synthase [bacterium]|nr:threonylcarbamoyl-AMP synthase [bacterium]